MQRSWHQSQQWLVSSDCHSLCRVLATLPTHAEGRKLQQIFAQIVAAFLRPARELIACLEASKCPVLNTKACINFLDAETLAFVKAVDIGGHMPVLDPGVVSTGTSPVGTRLFFSCACGVELLCTNIDINDCEALSWRKVNLSHEPEVFSISSMESLAISPDGLQMVVGCQIRFTGPEELYQETLLFIDTASLTTTHRMPINCEPTHVAYSQTGDRLAVVGKATEPDGNSGPCLLALISTVSMSVEEVCEMTSDARVQGVFFTCVGQLIVCYEPNEFGESLTHSCNLIDNPKLVLAQSGGPHFPSMWTCDRSGKHLVVMNDPSEATWNDYCGPSRSPSQSQTMVLDCITLNTIAVSTQLPRPDQLAFTVSGEHLVFCKSVEVWGFPPTQSASTNQLRKRKPPSMKTERMSEFYVVDAESLTLIRSVRAEFSLHRGLSGRGMTLVPEGGSPCTTPDQFVTEHVMHIEPPAWRDEEVLAIQADLEWADSVEAKIQQVPPPGYHTVAASVPCESSDNESGVTQLASQPCAKLHILHFGSPPTSGHNAINLFRDQLLSGPELKPCREALYKAHGNGSCTLASGALIFTHPKSYSDVQANLSTCNFSSAGLHIIIDECFEYLVEEILGAMPFQRRPKLKPAERGRREMSIQSLDDNEVSAPPGQHSTIPLVLISRTFLQVAHPLRNQRSVSQSTTDGVDPDNGSYYRSAAGKPPVVNPRRKIPFLD